MSCRPSPVFGATGLLAKPPADLRLPQGVFGCRHAEERDGDPGFSLLELIIVILLLSLTLTLFLGINFRQNESFRLRGDGRKLYAFLQAARSVAILEGSPNTCRYDPGGNLVTEDLHHKTLRLQDEVRLIPPDEGNATETHPVMVFYPDGASDGGVIGLLAGEHRLDLTVDPILGGVSVGEGTSLAQS